MFHLLILTRYNKCKNLFGVSHLYYFLKFQKTIFKYIFLLDWYCSFVFKELCSTTSLVAIKFQSSNFQKSATKFLLIYCHLPFLQNNDWSKIGQARVFCIPFWKYIFIECSILWQILQSINMQCIFNFITKVFFFFYPYFCYQWLCM